MSIAYFIIVSLPISGVKFSLFLQLHVREQDTLDRAPNINFPMKIRKCLESVKSINLGFTSLEFMIIRKTILPN